MTASDDRVPPPLRKLLEWDEKLTDKVVDLAQKAYPPLKTQTWRSIFKVLEISCHGIPWIALTLISIYMIRSGRETQVNLMAALIYDIVIIALIKAVTRRKRPRIPPQDSPQEKMFFTKGPDKFSFPSGHASRAVMLVFFFSAVTGGNLLLFLILSAWAGAVCASRVLMRRHHVVDVVAGMGFGVLEWLIVAFLWIGEDTSRWIGGWIAGAEDEFDGS